MNCHPPYHHFARRPVGSSLRPRFGYEADYSPSGVTIPMRPCKIGFNAGRVIDVLSLVVASVIVISLVLDALVALATIAAVAVGAFLITKGIKEICSRESDDVATNLLRPISDDFAPSSVGSNKAL